MQECFRQYPDVYGSELADDEDEEDGQDGHEQPSEGVDQHKTSNTASDAAAALPEEISDQRPDQEANTDAGKTERAKSATGLVRSQAEPLSETNEAVPTAWHDTRDAEPQAQ